MNFKTALPYYQIHYPHLNHDDYLQLYANEAFLRRASFVGGDFIIKGSFVSRAYMNSPAIRYPQDLDFLTLTQLVDSEAIAHHLSKWVNAVTTYPCDDGVLFTPFDIDSHWELNNYPRIIADYETEFATIDCVIDYQKIRLNLDISLHLPLSQKPHPITINTATDSLYFEYSPTIFTQIAWKISECLFHPRLKDIYDLIYLLEYIDNKKDRNIMINCLLCDFKQYTRKDVLVDKTTQFFKLDENHLYHELKNNNQLDDDNLLMIQKSCPLFKNSKDLIQLFVKCMKDAYLDMDSLKQDYPFLFDKRFW